MVSYLFDVSLLSFFVDDQLFHCRCVDALVYFFFLFVLSLDGRSVCRRPYPRTCRRRGVDKLWGLAISADVKVLLTLCLPARFITFFIYFLLPLVLILSKRPIESTCLATYFQSFFSLYFFIFYIFYWSDKEKGWDQGTKRSFRCLNQFDASVASRSNRLLSLNRSAVWVGSCVHCIFAGSACSHALFSFFFLFFLFSWFGEVEQSCNFLRKLHPSKIT